MQHETINRMKRKLYENEEVEDDDVGNDVSSLPIGNLYDTTKTNGSTNSFTSKDQQQDNGTDHYHHRHKQQQVTSPKAKRILQLFDADLDTTSKDTMDDVNDKPLSQDFQEEYSSNTVSNTMAGVYSNGYTSVATTNQTQQQQHTYQVRSLTALYRDNRRTNDEIHSSINLGPVITCIIDTPPMQRLRGLKQLGCAEYVYMNVNHNRFEHSLGVASLAETLCRKICIQQPSLLCTEKDILCVQLAGLLHDIGHGPFSHSYETFVLVDFPSYYQKNTKVQSLYNDSGWPDVPKDWTHESASLLMIDAALAYLGLAIDVHNLDQPLKQIGNGIDAKSMRTKGSTTSNENDDLSDSTILTNRDWIFVKECIWGKPIPDIEKVYGPGFHGRTGEHQDWLYDIVANRHSGLDVDKVDYYARDRRRALREAGEIDKLMIEEAIVAWAPCTDPKGCHRCRCQSNNSVNIGETKSRKKHLMICYPDKMVGASMNFFKTRFELHSIIYKHKTNVGVAHMISDILCLADPHFLISIAPFSGPNGSHSIGIPKMEYEFLPLSRAMLHPMSYLRLRDSVIDQIEATTCPELEPARKLVHRLWSRDLYKCVATKVLKVQKLPKDRRIWELSSSGIVKDIVDLNAQHDDGNGGIIQLIEYDVIVDKCQIHHGQKHLDPLAKMRFVEKSQLNKLSTSNYKDLPEAKIVSDDEYDSFLPRTLMECSLRIYCRDTKKVDLLRHAFELWWDSIHDEMEITIEPNRNANRQPQDNIAILSQETDDEDDNANELYNDETAGVESINHFGNDGSFPPWCSPN